MKKILLRLVLLAFIASTPASLPAQTNLSSPASVPVASEKETAGLGKHVTNILMALALNDPAKEAKVRHAYLDFSAAKSVWHRAHDAQLKKLWAKFNQARSHKDVAAANQALADIDEVYASFLPQHQTFIAALSAVLTPSQVETVEDTITVNKVSFTYNVYLQIFPTLTEAQKTVVLADLKEAREQGIDAGNMVEISAFFKKYKIKVEDEYLTAQGYHPQQARKDFAARLKAKDTAKPGAGDTAQ